jgi:hypothetical protein
MLLGSNKMQGYVRHYAIAVLLSTLLFAICWLFYVVPEIKYRKVLSRYPRGTAAEKVLRDYGGTLELHKSSNYLGPDPSEDEKRGCVGYYLYLPGENACLFFNYYQDLLRVSKATSTRKLQ